MASGNDMKSANEAYGGFVAGLKWGSIVIAITVLVVMLIIS